MRTLILSIVVLTIWTGCRSHDENAGSAPGPAIENNAQAETGARFSNEKSSPKTFNWTKKEQAKFLADCEAGADQHFTGKKLKDFCSCMLEQSQKYYSTYREMERKSNDDHDVSILESCSGFLDEEEE